MKKPWWTKEEDQVLLDKYLTHKIKDLYKDLPRRTFSGIHTRARSLGLQKQKRKSINENFFETPNIVNAAVSGYISADGCIAKNGVLAINIALEDVDYLKKVAACMNYEGKFYIGKQKKRKFGDKTLPEGDRCQFSTYGTYKLCEDLEKNFSITPRKTLTLQPPKLTELDHILAFLSGSIDGDGSIMFQTKNVKNGKKLKISFLGTYDLMVWVKSVFDNLFPLSADNDVNRDHNIYQYGMKGAKAYLFSKMVLAMPIPRLDRKWDRAREYIWMVENLEQDFRLLEQLNKLISPQIISFLAKYGEKIPEKFHNNLQTV